MNILLLSQVYPAFPRHSPQQVSYALHHLARNWCQQENVLVVRPYFLPHSGGENKDIKRLSFSIDGVEVLTLPFCKIPRSPMTYMGGLYKTLTRRTFRPQVVTAHVGYGLYLGYRVSRQYKCPLVAGVHHGDLLYGDQLLGNRRLLAIYDHASAIACRSHSVYKRFVELYPHFRERCFVAYSGIPGEIMENRDFGLGKLHLWRGEKGGTVRFLSACSLLPLKNIHVNLRVLSRLDPHIEWTYRVAGDGPERTQLETLARELGIGDRVRFLGHLPRQEVLREMEQSYIFVMVSAPETFGLVYLEALAKGNIVVGARGYGIDGVIEHNKNGFLCEPRDESGLLATLENILRSWSNAQLAGLLDNAHKTISAYTEEQAARHYLEHIRKFTQET